MSYEDLKELVTFRPLEHPIPGSGHAASSFKAPWRQTVKLLERELRLHGARGTVLEIDMRERDFRLDGLPRADARAQSPGVVLSFTAGRVPGEPPLRYEVGTYVDFQDNIRAIALGLEALRAVDRYGVTKRGEQYAGWKQLTAGGPSVERGRALILQHGSLREALRATHPDHGGNALDFADVQAARSQNQP